jgi:hypothetical protein
MSQVKSSIDIALGASGNATASIDLLNNNFAATDKLLQNIDKNVITIDDNVNKLASNNPFSTWQGGLVTVSSALTLFEKLAPAVLNAANAINVLEDQILKAALANDSIFSADQKYNSLSKNITAYGNQIVNSAVKMGNSIE